MQRIAFENLQDCPEIKDPSKPYFNNPEAYAMDRFAYYPCFKCKVSFNINNYDNNDSDDGDDQLCGFFVLIDWFMLK